MGSTSEDRIRVLRVLEYTYTSMEAMAVDMQRWGVPPTGVRANGGVTIRSSYMLPEFMPGMAEAGGAEPGHLPTDYAVQDLTKHLSRSAFLRGCDHEAVATALIALDIEDPTLMQRKINFIKEMRTATNLGLKEAKDAVESFETWQTRRKAMPQ